MTVFNALQLSPLSEFVWPVTYRYRVATSWGESQHSLTMDTPVLVGDVEATGRFGRSLWGLAVAGATSFLAQMFAFEAIMWKANTSQIVPVTPPVFGMQPHLPSPRGDTPAVQLHSGHGDTRAIRRFPIIGAPAGWSSGRLLTDTGKRILEQSFQRIKIASARQSLGGPLEWLIAYENVEPGGNLPPIRVAFRRVEYVRVLHHTLRAPAPSLGL